MIKFVDRDKLLALLDQAPPEWGYAELTEAYRAAYGGGDEIRTAVLHQAVYELRGAGLTTWGSDDARLREDSLSAQLRRNAGRGFGRYQQHTIVQYLRQYDRLRQGLPTRLPRGAIEKFVSDLRESKQVVDLRADGEPYIRPARPWELGHLVVQLASE